MQRTTFVFLAALLGACALPVAAQERPSEPVVHHVSLTVHDAQGVLVLASDSRVTFAMPQVFAHMTQTTYRGRCVTRPPSEVQKCSPQSIALGIEGQMTMDGPEGRGLYFEANSLELVGFEKREGIFTYEFPQTKGATQKVRLGEGVTDSAFVTF